jgi:dTDP-4-dehydrorhamnose reductase
MGGHIYLDLKEKGFEVDKVASKNVNYHDEAVFWKFLLNGGYNVVVNCSGFTGKPNVDEAESRKSDCWRLNVTSPLRINEMCDELEVNYIHVSSGCIYDGYHSEFTELDTPNFGLFQNHSSFYSKSKHAFELMSAHLNGQVLRMRMPFGSDISYRNYLSKIARYTDLVDYQNSKTYIPDFCNVVSLLIDRYDGRYYTSRQIFNVVNPSPLYTREVCEIMQKYGRQNNYWKFVPMSDLQIVAPRSNCVLNGDKLNQIYQMKTETEALEEIFS